MADAKMVTLTIDDRPVTVPEGTLVLDAARQLGINIPIFCSHHRLRPLGACRICLVEREKSPKPVIACAEVVAEGMVIRTQSDTAIQARTGIMEYLLVNHPLDCPVCDEGGECDLQDTSYEHGVGQTRFVDMKRNFEGPVDLGPIVVLDRNRCIVCARCVRYCNDIMGDSALTIEERGFGSQINSKDGGPLDCQQCGNCIEVCPVGALTSRPYRFKARPWDLKQTETVCNFCSNGCTFHLGRMGTKVLRARAKRAHGVNRDFLCVRGRYGYEFVSSADRLQFPRVRADVSLERAEWVDAVERAAAAITAAKAAGKAVAGLATARLSNEDLFLFQRLLREVIGTPHMDHRLRARQALSGATLRKLAAFEAPPVAALEKAGAVLVFGEDLNEEQPLYGTSVLREVQYRRMPVVVAHSRRVRLMQEPVSRLLHPSGGELAAARGLLKAVAANAGSAEAYRAAASKDTDGWTWESLESGAGVKRPDFEKAAATLLSAGPRIIYFGSQVLASPDAEAIVAALMNLALLAGAGLVPLWERSNSQGAVDMGVLPDLGPGYAPPKAAGWNTRQILEKAAAGEVGVLILAGANPLAHFPDRKLAETALRRVDFILTLELFDTDVAAMSHAVLPASSYAEADGSMTSAERRIQALRAASPAVGDSMPDWRIFERLANALGAPWSFADTRALQDFIRDSVPLYRGVGRRSGPAAAIWRLEGASLPAMQAVGTGSAPAAAAATGSVRVETGNIIFHHGTLSRRNPVQSGLLPGPVIYLDAADARRLGVAEGDLAQLDSGSARIEVKVRTDGPTAPGVAFFPDHFQGAEANRIIGPAAAHADLKLVPLGTAVPA